MRRRSDQAEATVIGIDAPAELSAEPPRLEDMLSPKFRRARCAEIALGREHGIWVPWTSPTGPPVSWSLAGSVRSELIAVVPYAAFRRLTRPAPEEGEDGSKAGSLDRIGMRRLGELARRGRVLCAAVQGLRWAFSRVSCAAPSIVTGGDELAVRVATKTGTGPEAFATTSPPWRPRSKPHRIRAIP